VKRWHGPIPKRIDPAGPDRPPDRRAPVPAPRVRVPVRAGTGP